MLMHVYLHTRHSRNSPPENPGNGPDTNSIPLYLILHNNCVHCTRTLVSLKLISGHTSVYHTCNSYLIEIEIVQLHCMSLQLC